MSEVTSGSVTSLDGTHIGFLQQGSGPGLVLIQGAGGSAYNYSELSTLLSTSFTVYRPDRRGRGMSPKAYTPSHSITRDVEDLDALLVHTGATRVYGLSSGAMITLEATRTLPKITQAAIYEPPFYPLGISHDGIARFHLEVESNDLPSAMVTLLQTVRISPPLLLGIPRPIFWWITNAVARFDEWKDGPGLRLRELIPAARYDVNDVGGMDGKMEMFRRIERPVLFTTSSFLVLVQYLLPGTPFSPMGNQLSAVAGRATRVTPVTNTDKADPHSGSGPDQVPEDVAESESVLPAWDPQTKLLHYNAYSGVDTSLFRRLWWAMEICRALKILDDVGIAHADLHCDNIFVGPPGDFDQVHIFDFGLAVLPGGQLTSWGFPGPPYTCLNGKLPDPRIKDIFSFGHVLYTLLHGSHPFQLAETEEIEEHYYINSFPRVAFGVPPLLEELMKDCWYTSIWTTDRLEARLQAAIEEAGRLCFLHRPPPCVIQII
ncbi:hypothetical protein RQP46_010242 [Phenoliferia psychrophenolica]